MKIILPDNLDDISLGMYIKYMAIDKEDKDYINKVFSLFTNIDIDDIKNIPKKQKDEVISHLDLALQSEGEFKSIFKIDNKEFGFIPNLDKITVGEYTDLVASSKNIDNQDKDLITLIAVLYRPIKQKDSFGNYLIEEYNGTKGHEKYIEKLPMSIVNGCLGFFLNLSNDLEAHILRFTEEEHLRVQMH